MKFIRDLKKERSQLRWNLRFWWGNFKVETKQFLLALIGMTLRGLAILAVVIMVVRVVTALDLFPQGILVKDDTDPPNGISGMGLYTDHKTGCQYLAARRSLILTPRLDKEGRHVCIAVGS